MNLPLKFNYDYSECMVMKLGLAIPDKEHTNKSKVLLTFNEALDYIKRLTISRRELQKYTILSAGSISAMTTNIPISSRSTKRLKEKRTKPLMTALSGFRMKQKNIIP